MHKNTKSKKNSNDKLRKILDNISVKDLSPEEKKHLTSLGKRLEEQSIEDTVEYKKVLGVKDEEEIDPLKPRVTIHHRPERKNYITPEEKKIITKSPEEVEKEELPEFFEKKEDLYEVEKVEVHEPEFIEVKPKETSKTGKEKIDEEIIKDEKEQEPYNINVEEQTEKKDDIPEWEAVEESIIKDEEKSIETEEIIKQDFEEKKEEVKESKDFKEEELTEWEPIEFKEKKTDDTQDKNFCIQCGKKIEGDTFKFCPECGYKFNLEEKGEPVPSFIPVKKIEKKDKEPEWEPTEEGTLEEEEKEIVDKEKKIEVFKDIKCIDEKTAVLLYDTGFTTVDDLKKISLRNLKRVDGIGRKLAKKIKKEIEGTIKLPTGDSSGFSEYLIDEDFEKGKEYIADKKIAEKETEEINVFEDVDSIDKQTAKLLYENGITSISILRNTSIDDLTKIRGIRRKLAKKIKKELGDLSVKEDELEPKEKDIPFESGDLGEWEYFDEKDADKGKREKKKGYRFGEYALYEKKITTKGNHKRTIRFFSKSEPDQGKSINLPKGYEVKVNKKTKLPYLKKKK